MNKSSSIEAVNTSCLSDQPKLRLNKVIKIEDYFNSEFQRKKQWVKNLVNTLLLLIILTRFSLLYLKKLEEYLLFLLQMLFYFVLE